MVEEKARLERMRAALGRALFEARWARAIGRRSGLADLDDRLKGPVGLHMTEAIKELLVAWKRVNDLLKEEAK